MEIKEAKQLKPGQTVKVEIISLPKARRSRLALNNIFRHSPDIMREWNRHHGEPRIRASVKEPRKFLRRRRPHNEQRYHLLPGQSCEIPRISNSQINDLLSVGNSLRCTVISEPKHKGMTVVGFGK